jgi:hypothetical protein
MAALLAYAVCLVVAGLGWMAAADGVPENTEWGLPAWTVVIWCAASLAGGAADPRVRTLWVPWAVAVLLIGALIAGVPFAEIEGHTAADVFFGLLVFAAAQSFLVAVGLAGRRIAERLQTSSR